MDERDRLALVERYIEGFNSGDPDAVLDVLHPEVVLEPLVGTRTPGTDLAPQYRGREAFVEMMNEARAQGAEFMRLDGHEPHGESALLADVMLIGQRSGVGVAEPAIAAVAFEDGRIIYGGMFKDRAVAIQQLESLGMHP